MTIRLGSVLPVCVLVATGLLAQGCGSPRPTADDWSRLSELPPLPYALHIERVSVVAEGGAESTLPYRTQVELRTRLTKALEDGFARSGVFARVTAEESEGDGAQSGAAASDLTLRASVILLKARGLPAEEVHAGAATATGFLWFLTMIPAWFVADRSYEPIVRVVLEASGRDSPAGAARVFDGGKISLSFTERASLGQYALQCLLPVVLIPADAETARESLIEKTLDEVELEASSYFKRDFARERISKRQPFLVIPVDAATRERGVVLLLPGEIVDFELDGVETAVGGSKSAGAYLREALEEGPARLECLKRVQSYLTLTAREDTVPGLDELDKAYSHVYRFENIFPEARKRHLEVTYHGGADVPPVACSWTLPST